MNLSELLDLCQDQHSDDWVEVPEERPATLMFGRIFGSHLAVYEPNPELSMLWLVSEDPDERFDTLPDWAEGDAHDWQGRSGYVVILLNGAPIWQTHAWYMTWGSGVGGFVPRIERPIHDGEERGYPANAEWVTTKWEASLARLLNAVTYISDDWHSFDPVSRLVPVPAAIHPIGATRHEY